jgi:flagellar protein FlaF
MHNSAAQAYSQTSKKTVNPRELEAGLLIKAAAQLQSVRDDWEARKGELSAALLYNRRLWTVFADSVTKEDNPLPLAIKQNIANLALFVFNQTLRIQTDPKPDLLTSIISINKDIASGLRGDDGSQPDSQQNT